MTVVGEVPTGWVCLLRSRNAEGVTLSGQRTATRRPPWRDPAPLCCGQVRQDADGVTLSGMGTGEQVHAVFFVWESNLGPPQEIIGLRSLLTQTPPIFKSVLRRARGRLHPSRSF